LRERFERKERAMAGLLQAVCSVAHERASGAKASPSPLPEEFWKTTNFKE